MNARARYAACSLFVLLGGCLTVAGQFRALDEGQVYRSGQLGGRALEQVIERHELRTIINLRGSNPDEGWYIKETAVAAEAGIAHHDLDWSMRRIPDPESLARFLELIETEPRPILIHCQGGTHRAGAGAAFYVLARGGTVEEAREQLGLFFGDAPIGEVLDMYEGSATDFRTWVLEDYPHLYRQRAAETAP